MDTTKKLEDARKCINQALVGLAEREKEDVFEIRIPNLRLDETEIVRTEIKNFTKELLNKLTTRRNTGSMMWEHLY